MKIIINYSNLYKIRKKYFVILFFYILSVVNRKWLVLGLDSIFIENENDDKIGMPKGIFHHSEVESEINTKYTLPDWGKMNPLDIATSLFDTVAEVTSKRKQESSVHLPMPFGLSPLNIQLTKDSNSGIKLSEPSSTILPTVEMSDEEREAFLNARIVCLQQDDQACVRALDKLHIVKYGFSKLVDNDVKRKVQSQINLGDIVQQGLMEWVLPNVEKKLREMRSGDEVRKFKISKLPSRFP